MKIFALVLVFVGLGLLVEVRAQEAKLGDVKSATNFDSDFKFRIPDRWIASTPKVPEQAAVAAPNGNGRISYSTFPSEKDMDSEFRNRFPDGKVPEKKPLDNIKSIKSTSWYQDVDGEIEYHQNYRCRLDNKGGNALRVLEFSFIISGTKEDFESKTLEGINKRLKPSIDSFVNGFTNPSWIEVNVQDKAVVSFNLPSSIRPLSSDDKSLRTWGSKKGQLMLLKGVRMFSIKSFSDRILSIPTKDRIVISPETSGVFSEDKKTWTLTRVFTDATKVVKEGKKDVKLMGLEWIQLVEVTPEFCIKLTYNVYIPEEIANDPEQLEKFVQEFEDDLDLNVVKLQPKNDIPVK